jgi:hypothetical protein
MQTDIRSSLVLFCSFGDPHTQGIYKPADLKDVDFLEQRCINGIESPLFSVGIRSAPGLCTSPVLGMIPVGKERNKRGTTSITPCKMVLHGLFEETEFVFAVAVEGSCVCSLESFVSAGRLTL